MYECEKCKENKVEHIDENEFVCENCGAVYWFKYAGVYVGDSQERTDEGFEPKEWLDKYNK